MGKQRIYDRAYRSLEEYRGKYVADREACQRVLVVVILRDGEIVGKVVAAYPRDGAGTLWADLFDWTDREGGTVVWHGTASGYGYDKLAGALDGAPFGGLELCHNWESQLRDAGYVVTTLL